MILTMDSNFEPFQAFGLIYLATPYTKYVYGLDAGAQDASLVAGRLIRKGLNIYAPIPHTHAIAKAAGIDPIDYDFWMGVDKAFMDKSDALIVAHLAGWDQSRGVAAEIEYFTDKKPVFHLF